MPNTEHLNEMLISSILKLHLLRKGYSVSEQNIIGDKRYDLAFSKRSPSSEPVVLIDLKKYSSASINKAAKPKTLATYYGRPAEAHIVWIKSDREVVTDPKLARLIGSDKELRVISYDQAT